MSRVRLTENFIRRLEHVDADSDELFELPQTVQTSLFDSIELILSFYAGSFQCRGSDDCVRLSMN